MASEDLSMLLFTSNSQFRQDLAELQGIESRKEGQGQIKKLLMGKETFHSQGSTYEHH